MYPFLLSPWISLLHVFCGQMPERNNLVDIFVCLTILEGFSPRCHGPLRFCQASWLHCAVEGTRSVCGWPGSREVEWNLESSITFKWYQPFPNCPTTSSFWPPLLVVILSVSITHCWFTSWGALPPTARSWPAQHLWLEVVNCFLPYISKTLSNIYDSKSEKIWLEPCWFFCYCSHPYFNPHPSWLINETLREFAFCAFSI